MTENFNPYKTAWENLLLALEANNVTFSKNVSEALVGSGKLIRLIEEGKIEADKPTNKQNGKWFCKASDVVRHIRNMRKRTSQTK